ncbi:helix-hairpin-helix domain-containing protein [Streptomyces sp. NPDC001514]
MTYRSRSATSGPGRAPASDGRVRDSRRLLRAGRRRPASASSISPSTPSSNLPPPSLSSNLSQSQSPSRSPRRSRSSQSGSAVALRRRADALFRTPGAGAVASAGGTAPADTPVRGTPGAPEAQAVPRAGGALGAPGALRTGPLPLPWPPAPEGEEPGPSTPELSARERGRLALRERLPLWIQLRCGVEPRTLAALTVVLVVAVGFAVQHFWTGRPEPVRAPELVRESRPAPAAPVGPEPEPSPGPPPTAGPGARIVVDVSGKVRRPGVLRLPAGSRVADALRAAGGVKAGTDITGLNRARVLMDGEQVVVGAPPTLGAPAPGGTSGTGGASAGPAMGPVSLNSATVEQLDTLPGVGPVLAQHIVDYRTEHGGFRSVDELREVKGIGDRRFADLQTLVRP